MSIENTQKNDISAIISRMKTALGVTSDVALCRKLGSKSTGLVGNWRKAGGVPDGAIAKASQISEKPVEWFKTGKLVFSASSTTNEPELVRTCEVEWSAGHHASEPLKLTHDEAMMVEFMRELDDQERADIMDNIREAWLLKRHKQNPTE